LISEENRVERISRCCVASFVVASFGWFGRVITVRVRRGYHEYRLLDRWDGADGHVLLFRDSRHARDFLGDLACDALFLQALRSKLSGCETGSALHLADRPEIVRLAADLVVRGRLRVSETRHRPTSRVMWEPDNSPAASPARPIGETKAPTKSPPSAPKRSRLPIPNDDPGWEPQRQALKSAHVSAAPFCEECAKRAMLQGAAA
jgi:hypothetical protein